MRPLMLFATLVSIAVASLALAEEPPDFLESWGGCKDTTCSDLFHYPFDVAIDAQGDVYVADGFHSQIKVFTRDGTFLREWGSNGTGPGQLLTPLGIAFDSQGNVYVVSANMPGGPQPNTEKVQKFDRNGGFLSLLANTGSGPGQVAWPNGIAVDRDGNVYVLDRGNNRIEIFDPAGNYSREVPCSGCYNIAIDQKNDWIIVSGSAGAVPTFTPFVKKVDRSGNLLQSWEGPPLISPEHLATDADGNIFVSDNYRVLKFDSSGIFLTMWGHYGYGDGEFRWTAGLDVDAEHNVYVADASNNRVEKFGKLSVPAVLTTWARVKSTYR